jgi:hypothetical protein
MIELVPLLPLIICGAVCLRIRSPRQRWILFCTVTPGCLLLATHICPEDLIFGLPVWTACGAIFGHHSNRFYRGILEGMESGSGVFGDRAGP